MPLGPSFPELASLDLFVSVVELGSVSRAAAAHGVAQPSASGRLRHLERQLGMQLLDRSPSGSVPTDAGVVVAGWAEAILRSAHELRVGLSAFQAEQAGRLRVAASFTIAEYLLPQWLERFSREHPGDSVALAVHNSTAVIERLRSGEAELGFIETPSATRDLDHRIVARDELIAVVSPNHPWAAQRSVPVEALAATPLVTREAGSGTREALEAALAAQGLGPPTALLELGSTAAVRSAVIYGKFADGHQSARRGRRDRGGQPHRDRGDGSDDRAGAPSGLAPPSRRYQNLPRSCWTAWRPVPCP